MTKKLENKKGFTLTELIVVIVIIGILAAVLIPTLTGYIKKANISAAEQEAQAYVTAYNSWLIEKNLDLKDKNGDKITSFEVYCTDELELTTVNSVEENFDDEGNSIGFTVEKTNKYTVVYTVENKTLTATLK